MYFTTNLLGREVKFNGRTGELVMVVFGDTFNGTRADCAEYVVLTDRINVPGKELVVLKQKDLTFEEEYEFN